MNSSSRPLADFGEGGYTNEELKRVQESVLNGWGNIYWVATDSVDRLRPTDE